MISSPNSKMKLKLQRNYIQNNLKPSVTLSLQWHQWLLTNKSLWKRQQVKKVSVFYQTSKRTRNLETTKMMKTLPSVVYLSLHSMRSEKYLKWRRWERWRRTLGWGRNSCQIECICKWKELKKFCIHEWWN